MSSDKTILVTGATDGIGKQTALELARMGARVIVHGRNAARAQTAAADIRQSTKNDRIEICIADFASQKQIRQMAVEIKRQVPRLDVLINNAGVMMSERVLTEDGLETTFAVNHLAYFLLTHLLLDLLKASAPARIVNVSSGMHRGVHVDFDNLQGEKYFDRVNAYSLSKLGNVLFTYTLAERLKDSGVTVNCLHPGVVDTKLFHASGYRSGRSWEEGAQTPVYLATSSDVEGVTGKYFASRQIADSSPSSHDKKLQSDFWRISAELTGLDV